MSQLQINFQLVTCRVNKASKISPNNNNKVNELIAHLQHRLTKEVTKAKFTRATPLLTTAQVIKLVYGSHSLLGEMLP